MQIPLFRKHIRFLSVLALAGSFGLGSAIQAEEDVYRSVSQVYRQVRSSGLLDRGCSCAGGCACDSIGCNDCTSCTGAGDMYSDSSIGAAAPPPSASPGFGQLAGGYGATGGANSPLPGMIGDFFGGGYSMRIQSAGQTHGHFTTVPGSGGARRSKIAENNSPLPIDRVFFNYHFFKGALASADNRSSSLDRYTFGYEKTFLDGTMSAELRVPFVHGLDPQQVAQPSATDNNEATAFGNMSLAIKAMLYEGRTVYVSAGLGMIFPTAADAELYMDSRNDSNPDLLIENDSVFLQPFLGVLWTPRDRRCWVQFFSQADFDTTGSKVTLSGNPPSTGVLQDQTLLFMDLSVGRWIYRSSPNRSIITGLAPILELHYSTTLNDTDVFRPFPGDEVLNPANRLDILNLTAGLRFELHGNSWLTVAAVAPLRDGEEALFDTEVGVQYIRFL